MDNTTIWTQTNLSQWAQNSNKGSWYKYLQSSKSLQSSVKGRMMTSSNLGASVQVINPPVTNWVESDSIQWVYIEKKQWLSLFSESKALWISIIASALNSVIDIKASIKPFSTNVSNLSAIIYSGFNGVLNLLASIRAQEIEYNSWTDVYKSQWVDNDISQWLHFLWHSNSLDVYIKSTIQRTINLMLIVKGLKTDYINFPAYLKQNFNSLIELKVATKGFYQDSTDLKKAIKSLNTITKDLVAAVRSGATTSVDLPVRFKLFYRLNHDFIKIIRGWGKDTFDLPNYIKSTLTSYRDLSAYVKKIAPSTPVNLSKYIVGIYKDTLNLVNAIRVYTKNVPFNLIGYTKLFISGNILNLPSYVKSTEVLYKDLLNYLQPIPPVDLTMMLVTIPPVDLSVYLRVDDRVKWLHVYIRALQERSLGGFIRPVYPFDLSSYIKCILPVNISASIYCWHAKDLFSTIIATAWPELTVSIFSIPPKDLKVSIVVYKNMKTIRCLSLFIRGMVISNLSASIIAVGFKSSVGLLASVFAKGQIADLQIKIKPKVIFMKAVISVSLLEHFDLNASINFGCMSSMYVSLPITAYCLYLKELKAYLKCAFGKQVECDLLTTVNNTDYTVVDFIDVEFFIGDRSDLYTQLDVKFYNHNGLLVVDTIPIVIGKLHFKGLKASINCILTSLDMPITITAVTKPQYKFIPEWIDINTRRIVIDSNRAHKQWHRIVEFFFSNHNPNSHYFYIEKENKLYSINRDSQWVVIIKSFKPNSDKESTVKKLNERSKYLIRLSDFNTIDEAVKYFIDRTSTYRTLNLSASISTVIPPRKDLNCYLYSNFIYRWSKGLSVSIIGDYVKFNLSSFIKSTLNSTTQMPNIIIPTRHGIANLKVTVRYYSTTENFMSIIKGITNCIKDINVSITPVT